MLFIRDENKIILNENGKNLLEKTAEILSQVEKLYLERGNSLSLLKGHFQIGASLFLMKKYLIDVFLKIQKNHLLNLAMIIMIPQ